MGAITILRNADQPRRSQQKIRIISPKSPEGWRKGPDPEGFLFEAKTHTLTSLDDLAVLLRELEEDPYAAVIRGAPKQEGQIDKRRGSSKRPDEENTFTPRACQWLMLDIDAVPNPPGHDFKRDPQAALEALRASFPAPWNGAAAYWQASGSAGLKPGVCAHLWYWLDRPVDERYLKSLFRTKEGKYQLGSIEIDQKVFQTIHLHFTSRPAIIDAKGAPAPDPMEVRSGMLPGATEVTLPEGGRILPFMSAEGQEKARKKLERVCKGLASLPEGRTNAAFNAGRLMGSTTALPAEEIVHAIATAVASAGEQDYPRAKAEQEARNGVNYAREGDAAPSAEWRQGMELDELGMAKTTPMNLAHILAHHPALAGALAWNDRRHALEIKRQLPWRHTRGTWDSAADPTELRIWLNKELGMIYRPDDIKAAAVAEAKRHAYDPFRTYLDELEWDGTPRLHLMHTLFEVDTSPYAERTFAWWLISAVARTYGPGCQADHMLILQGPQGVGKTSGLKALVPDPIRTFSTMIMGQAQRDNRQTLHGPVLVCLDELAGLRGKAAENIKSYVSETTDFMRIPYAPAPDAYPRTNVFCGTTNEETFLHDYTGARRFWPHRVARAINVRRIEANRDQLWAEAVHRYQAGERWYPAPQEVTELALSDVQESYRAVDALEEILADRLSQPQSPSGWDKDQLDSERCLLWLKSSQLRQLDPDLDPIRHSVNAALRGLGWKPGKVRGARVWLRPDGEQ